MSELLQMKVKAVTLDQGGGFLVLLADQAETKILPIAIGPFEAQSIALVLQGKASPRPLTHDLLKSVCESLGGTLKKIIITNIIESTFYAELYLEYQGEELVLDSRPSDALALALRWGAAIYMAPRLVEFTYDYQDIIEDDSQKEDLH